MDALLARLDAALREGKFNEASLLLRRCEPEQAQDALALCTPYRNRADLVAAFAELKERAKKSSGGKR